MRSTVAGQLHRSVDLHWHNYGGDAHLGKKTHVLLVANTTPGVLWDLQRHRNRMETLENRGTKSDESVALHQKDVFLSLTFQWPRGFSQTRNPIEKWRFIAGEIINGGFSQGKSSINDGFSIGKSCDRGTAATALSFNIGWIHLFPTFSCLLVCCFKSKCSLVKNTGFLDESEMLMFLLPSSGQHPIAIKIAHVQKYVRNMSHIFVINGDKSCKFHIFLIFEPRKSLLC